MIDTQKEEPPPSSFLSRNFSRNTHPLWTPGLASLTKMVPGHGWMGQTTRQGSSEYVCPILYASNPGPAVCSAGSKAKWAPRIGWGSGILGSHLFDVLRFWSPQQPDNWNGHMLGGGEDCAHFMDSGQWNDNVCMTPFRWVCEKKLGRAS